MHTHKRTRTHALTHAHTHIASAEAHSKADTIRKDALEGLAVRVKKRRTHVSTPIYTHTYKRTHTHTNTHTPRLQELAVKLIQCATTL